MATKRAVGFHKALSGLGILGHIPDHSVVSEQDKEGGDVPAGASSTGNSHNNKKENTCSEIIAELWLLALCSFLAFPNLCAQYPFKEKTWKL